MKRLLNIIFFKHKHRFLLVVVVFAMCFLTIASQLEILTIGIITKKGPEFFELFGTIQDGTLVQRNSVTHQEMEARFQMIDTSHLGVLTKADAAKFFRDWKKDDFLGKVMGFFEENLSLSANVLPLAILVVVIALFKAIALFIHRFSMKLISIRLSCDLRQDYFEHIQSLSMSFYQKQNMGSLSARVASDAVMISDAVNACLVNYLQTPFMVITTLALCFVTSWQLSLMIFLGLPLIMFPIFFIARRVKKISLQLQKNQESFSSVLLDFLGGIQTVKVFAMENFSLQKYREQNEKMAVLETKSARYDLSSRPIVHTMGMVFLSATLLYGLYILQMGLSEVFFYCGMLYLFYEPIKKFAEENSRIQRGVAAAERMFDVLDLKPEIADLPDAIELKGLDTCIEFDRVDFRYLDTPILKNLSFTVKKGESVAIVGATGAGKSTIVQLLPRLYDVQQGQIRINGKPLAKYTQKSLRECMAFVPQRPFLFLDTIAANIAVGRNCSKEQIISAARRAYAEEFIVQLPGGYDSEVSEAGKNLSGGQQQRLAIARALLLNAPILIMDEATSSLDAISENLVKTAISELRGQVTQIIIAHRLSTIEHVDKIIFLEKGEMVAEGTKEQLLQSCPGFKTLWELYSHQTNH